MAAVNWKRYERQRPGWYVGGSDGGKFAHALGCVKRFGGVLEHPANSHAWAYHNLSDPNGPGWQQQLDGIWVCEVWQSAYGHRARKRTWLAYSGHDKPLDLNWEQRPGVAQVGWFDRIKPTVGKKEASATPLEFRDVLISLARTATP